MKKNHFLKAVNGVYEAEKRIICEKMFLWFILALISTKGIGHKRTLECLDQFGLYVSNTAKDQNNIEVIRAMVEDLTGIHCSLDPNGRGVAYWVEDDKKELYGDYFAED